VKQLRNSNRWDGGKGIRYLIQSTSAGPVNVDLPAALPDFDGGAGSTAIASTSPPSSTVTTRMPVYTFTTTGTADVTCAAAWGNCLQRKCCSDQAMECYEKDQYYAQCKGSCTPGINPNDAPEYQTPWSCTILMSSGTQSSMSTTATTSTRSTSTMPFTTTTTTITTTTTTAGTCSGKWQNCKKKQMLQ